MSEFDRGRIIACRECGLLFHDIIRRTGRHPPIVMGIWNQWIAVGHTEGHAGSQRPPTTNAWEDRHMVRSALQKYITTSWIISQEIGLFAARPVTVLWCFNVCSSVACQFVDLSVRLSLIVHLREKRRLWCAERQSWIQECRFFRRVPVLRAVFWWPYTCLEAPRRPHVVCLQSTSA